jgi:hypothetical protein
MPALAVQPARQADWREILDAVATPLPCSGSAIGCKGRTKRSVDKWSWELVVR